MCGLFGLFRHATDWIVSGNDGKYQRVEGRDTYLPSPPADTLTLLATRIRMIREDGGADVEAAPFVVGEPEADYFER